MVKANPVKILFLLLAEELKNILYFPLWWYSKGFLKVVVGGGRMIADFDQSLGFSIWLKNLFVPMFGQHDFAGRAISFFLRLVQVVFKGFALLLIALFILAIYIGWLVLPIFIILMTFYTLVK